MAYNGVQIENSPNIIVITDSDANQITVTQPITRTVEVTALGPQGPVGPQGPSGSFDSISGSFVTTASFNAFTASYNTGSFTGSFVGSGAGLYNIPASGITGLTLPQIATGSVSASVSTGTASFTVTSGSSNFLFVSSSGNVGIGTVTPSYILDISGSARATGDITLGTGAVTDNSKIYVYGNNAGVSRYLRLEHTNGSTSQLVTDNTYLSLGAANYIAATKTLLAYGGVWLTKDTLIRSTESDNSYVDLMQLTSANLLKIGVLSNISSNGAVAIYSNEVERIRIDSSGLVGIGTTTPNATLDVSGSTNISGSLTLTGSTNITGALTASSAIISGNVTVLGTASINTLIVNQTQLSTGSNQLGDAANDTQTLYGTVRIPTGSLTVSGSSFFTGSLNLGTGTVIYGDTTNPSLVLDQTTGAYLKYGTTSEVTVQGSTAILKASNTVQLRTGTTTHLFVSSSGNVGIGTTSPAHKLVINGGAIFLNSDWPLYLGSTNAFIEGNSSGTIVRINGSAGFKVTNAGNTRFLIDTNGNVGIGTASPAAKLQVIGTGTTSTTTAFSVLNSSTSASLTVLDDSNVSIGGVIPSGRLHVYEFGLSSYKTYTTTNAGVIINSYQSQGNPYTKTTDIVAASDATVPSEIRLFTRTSGSVSIDERLRINSSGNVGIGTTTPGEKLEVAGNIKLSDGTQRNIIGALNNSLGIYASPNSTTEGIIFSTDNGTTAEMFIQDGGNVGIGTTTPTERLQVSGSVSIKPSGTTDTLLFTNLGSAQSRLMSNSNFAIWNSGSETVRFLTTGNVGIGNSSPTARLQVRGSGATSATTSFLVQNLSTSASLTVLDDGNIGIGTSTPLGLLHLKSNFTSGVAIIYDRTQNANVDSLFYTGVSTNGTTATDFMWMGTATSDMTITGTGNVGIGTSNPLQKLTLDTGNIGLTAGYGLSWDSDTEWIKRSGGGDQLQFGTSNTVRVNIGTGVGALVGVGIGSSAASAQVHIRGAGSTSATTALRLENSSASPSLIVTDDLNSRFYGNVGIGTPPSATLHISGSAGTGSALTVYKSGSTVMSIQGSQGELFSITDSLSGSLFSVSNISGLPILEVFSDNTVLLGSYLDPMLMTTQRVTANSGSTVIYSLPTASYDGVFVDYVIRSGSNARAGQFMGMWSGSSTNFTDNSTTDFGDTTGFIFGLIVSGSNMVLTGSASTDAWTVRAGIRSI